MRLPPLVLLGLLAVILVVQGLLLAFDDPPTLLLGAMDWTGHLATTAILLAALPGRLPRALIMGAFLALLIDLDHLPDIFGEEGIDERTPRPVSHSLTTMVVLGGLAAALRARASRHAVLVLGLAVGVGMHLLRDVFVGPGVSLLWPLSTAAVEGAFLVYFVALVLIAVYAARLSRRVQRRA